MFRSNRYLLTIITGLTLFLVGLALNTTSAAAQEIKGYALTEAASPIALGQTGTGAGIRYEPIGYVLTRRLNVRTGPSTQFPIRTAVYYGNPVYLLARNTSGSWLQVRLNYGEQGWVFARYISASADDVAGLPVNNTPPSPPPSIPVEAIGHVTSYRLNVRLGPGLDHPVIGQVWRGERVSLLGRNSNSNWLQIRWSQQSKGWVSARYIHSWVPIGQLPITEVGIPEPPPTHTGHVNIYRLNVRSGPGFYYRIIDRLRQSEQVQVYGRDVSSSWFKIGLPYGRQGWVAARYITIDTPISNLRTLDNN
jgi:uncharacterized protein YgiM (DUF1202 family)